MPLGDYCVKPTFNQDRLKSLVSKLSVIAEHRLDIIKTEGPYEVTQVMSHCLLVRVRDKAAINMDDHLSGHSGPIAVS